MFTLRKERRNRVDLKEFELKIIGLTTGKTTMIDSYEKAIDEVLACLSTFR